MAMDSIAIFVFKFGFIGEMRFDIRRGRCPHRPVTDATIRCEYRFVLVQMSGTIVGMEHSYQDRPLRNTNIVSPIN